MVRYVVAMICFAAVLTMDADAIEAGVWESFAGGSYPAPAEVEVIEQDGNGILVGMTLDGMSIQERKVQDRIFQFLSIPQAHWTKETGKPKLPVVRTLLTIPSNSDVKIQVEDSEHTILKDYNVYPVGEEVVKHRGEAVYIGEEFAIDEEFYHTNRFYPQELASISFSGYLRDQRLVQLEFRPIRYNPYSGELMCYSFLRVRLTYGARTGASSWPLSNVGQYDADSFAISSAPGTALGSGDGSVSYPDDLMEKHKADYVIIVPDQFYNSQRLRKLADWRAQYSGLDVVVAPTGKLYHYFGAGRGLDENIRSLVQYIYNYWRAENMPDGRVGYILLIGDVEHLPIHISDKKSYGEQIVTDNWYACVSGDDLLPDIMLGRLPAKNLTELGLMIDKIIQYEQNPLYGDWANSVLLLLGTEELLREDMEYARDEYLLPAGYNVSEVVALDGGKASDVISELNAGQLIVDYAGHGWTYGWEVFLKSDIPKLQNDRKLPAIFSLACSTGKFDYPETDSLAEAFVKHRYGAIAFFGSSRLAAISDVGFGLSEAVARAHIGTLGEVAMHTKLKLLPNSTDMELYNLLGDPALDLYAARRPPNKADLVVSSVDVSFEPQEPKQGEEVQIVVAIHNLGAADAHDVIVELRDAEEADLEAPPGAGMLIESHQIPRLPAGEKTEIRTVWRAPLGEAQHRISVEAFPADRDVELYGENNDAQKTLMVSLEAAGWPVEVEESILSAPITADIDGDGDLELLIQSAVYNYSRLYIWYHDSQPVSGWPKTIARAQYNTNSRYTNSSAGPAPAVGDLDGDGSPEIVAAFFENKVHAWRSDGSTLPGWPIRTSGDATSSPVLADLDTDGKLEVVCGLANGRMDIRRSDGSEFPEWPISVGRQGHLFPVVTDMDGDSDLEIVALLSPLPKRSGISTSALYAWHHDGTAVDGWPVQIQGADAILPPAAGDLDGDGTAEIVATSVSDEVCRIYVYEHDGSLTPGWPIMTDHEIRSALTLGDLDQDGDVEIIACSYSDLVYAWHHNGKRVYGWPVSVGPYGRGNSAPILGDVDGDDRAEVIFTSYGGVIHALKHNGVPIQGWPAITEERYSASPPVIADLEGDGKTELAYASGSKRIHMLSLTGNHGAQTGIEWNMFLHDQLHTGAYGSKAILPRPPADLTASDLPDDKGGSIALSWELSPDGDRIAGYVIFRSEQYDGQYSMIGKTARGVSTYTDDAAKVGVTYWYVVRASDGMYLSASSSPVSAYSLNNFAPQPPGKVSAYSADLDRTINIQWLEGEEDDLAGYRIYYGVSPRDYGEPMNTGLTGYYVLSGLTNDTVYYISVTAYDADGNESLLSREVAAVPRDEDTQPPSFSAFYPKEATEGVGFHIRCSISDPSGIYDDSSGADGQGVYLLWDNDGELLENSHPVQMSRLSSGTYITDVEIPGQSVGAHFVYQVYACDNDYDWEDADDRSRGPGQEQVIEFLKAPGRAYNYPNPAPAGKYTDRTIFRYHVTSDAHVKISIYDIAGRLVDSLEAEAIGGKYNEKEWDISNVASGIYIYVIEIQPASGNRQIVKKKLAIVR